MMVNPRRGSESLACAPIARPFFIMTLLALVGLALGGGAAWAATATDRAFGPAGSVHGAAGAPLAGPAAEGLEATVADFLDGEGHSAATIDSLRSTRQMTAVGSDTTTVDFVQEVEGLTVFGTQLRAVFDGDGALIALGENLVAAGLVVPAGVNARTAFDAALDRVHPGRGAGLSERGRSGNSVAFGGDDLFFSDPTVTRVAIPLPGQALQEGFLVETWTDDDNQLDHTLVDGVGQVLFVQRRTVNESFNVFTENPDATPQGVEIGPGGWLSGPQTTLDISGPNVHAYLDRNNNNATDGGGSTVSNGNFTSDACLNVDPLDSGPADSVCATAYDNQAVAVQSLFYFNNVIHDLLDSHGFDPASGNYEVGGPGGDDPVLAEAQDGGALNNANFAPQPDGTSSRMQMYLWDWTASRRDGDVDGDIVWHEFGHGLSFRLVDNLTGSMGGAVGEGASDTIALVYYDEDRLGEYSTGNSVSGIRSHAYDTYDETNRTYESIADDFGNIHLNGELYAASMWNLWTRYRDGGVADPQNQILADIVDGMKATTYELVPTFPDMRDGLLVATGGTTNPTGNPTDVQRWCAVWHAFAKYGVGVSQSTSFRRRGPLMIVWTWSEAFDVPAQCPTGPTDDPPSVTSVSAPNPAAGEVTVSATASDDNGVTQVQFFVDGSSIGIDADASGGWSVDWNSATVGDGDRTIMATATDTIGQTGSNSITVVVDNINAPPTIANQTFSIDVDAAAGSSVGTVVASDPENDPLTYAITGGNTGGAFDIDGTTGEITVASAAAVASSGSFALTVRVEETGNTTNADSATVTVNVTAPATDPTVISCEPSEVAQGQRVTIVVTGTNFDPNATVDMGSRIAIQNVNVMSDTRIDVAIKVHRRASGTRDVVVTNPDSGLSSTPTACLVIQ